MSAHRRTALFLFLLAVCATGALVQRLVELPRVSGRPGELYEAVSRQITAMREADYPRAYRQVSIEFQERVNAEAFTDLVEGVYPELVRASRVEFGRARFEGRYAVLQV
ncbi:MAG: DUF4864 domain-containing protein, partial [Verrucomicrobiota bacterium]|nr:DUF4864 domain-containing protein [Verrucomicrobiota bacterium]